MFGAIILFTQFFTRITVPIAIPDPMTKFNHSVQYLTVFGLLLGLLEGAIYFGLTFILPSSFAWLLAILADALLTGGFHLDAFADTADAVFSSRTPDKMRVIMKDSRLGTMGVLALITYYAVMLNSIAVLGKTLNHWQLAGLIVLLTTTAKAGLTILTWHMHYAGEQGGLAEMWQGVKTWQIVIGEIIYLILSVLLAGISGLISAVIVLALAWPYRQHFVRLFGGLTGDTIGAFTCVAQLVFLLSEMILNYTGLVSHL